MANRNQLRMTQPYDGNVGLRADSDNEDSEFNKKIAGKATFKVKQGDNAKTEHHQDNN